MLKLYQCSHYGYLEFKDDQKFKEELRKNAHKGHEILMNRARQMSLQVQYLENEFNDIKQRPCAQTQNCIEFDQTCVEYSDDKVDFKEIKTMKFKPFSPYFH